MNASIIRTSLASGFALASVAGFVLVPPTQQTVLARPSPAVALTAQAQPHAAPTPVVLHRVPDLLNQQVTFHIAIAADFVATGAVLVGRQLEIPGALLRDIQNGTPLPVAVGRALQTVVEIELDAARELVGFAVQYLDFQVRFIAQVVQDVMTTSATALATVSDFITPTVAATASARSSARVEEASARAIPPSDTAPDRDQVTEVRSSGAAGPTMSLSTPDGRTTLSAQGEIRSSSGETADPVAEGTTDANTPAERDNTVDDDVTGRTESAEADQRQPETTEADQHQPETAAKGGDTNDGSVSATGDE